MNEEMMEKLSVAETPDDVQVIAKEYDIELSDEDAAKLFSELEEIRASATDGKISDEALAGVAGGVVTPEELDALAERVVRDYERYWYYA